MRLRLDKLVLSAGLALAMVATTIPVWGSVKATKTTITNGESKTEVTAEEGLVTVTRLLIHHKTLMSLRLFIVH